MEHAWQYGQARPPSEPVRQARAVALDLFRSPLPGYQTDDRWLQQSKYVGLPYIFISNLAKPIRAADVRVLERRPTKGRTTFGPGGTIAKSTTATYGKSAREDYRPIDDDHPAARVIAEPQGDDGVDTIGDILEYGTIHGRLHGERPLWGVPSEKYLERGEYRPVQLYNLPPALLLPQPGRSMEYPMGWYRLMPYYPGGTSGWFGGRPVGATGVPLDAREVYRALYKHPSWKWAGYSPLTAAALMLDISESIDQARWSSMNRGIKPSVVVSVGGADESFLDALKLKMETKYGGSRNHDTAMVLSTPTTDGEVKVQNLFPSPKEFDYANSWDQAVAAVAAVFGVPRTVANLSTASAYAELYASRRQFHDSTVVPECREWSDFFTRVVGRPWSDGGRDICVEVIPQPVENEEAEQKSLEFGVQNDLIRVNEYRQKKNLAPLPGGDNILSVFKSKSGIAAGTTPDPSKPPPADPNAAPPNKGKGPTAGAPPRPENPEGEGTRPPTGQRPTTKAMSSLVDSAGGALIAPATVAVGRKLGRRKSRRYLKRLTGGK